MNGRKVFDTIIKKTYNSPYGDKVVNCNDHIVSRISGFSTALCDSDDGVTVVNRRNAEEPSSPVYGWMTVHTTEEQYERFKELVIKHYGDLCEFDVKLGHNKIYRQKQ